MAEQCTHGFLFKCGRPAIFMIHFKNTENPAFYCIKHVLSHVPKIDVLIRALDQQQAANCEEK